MLSTIKTKLRQLGKHFLLLLRPKRYHIDHNTEFRVILENYIKARKNSWWYTAYDRLKDGEANPHSRTARINVATKIKYLLDNKTNIPPIEYYFNLYKETHLAIWQISDKNSSLRNKLIFIYHRLNLILEREIGLVKKAKERQAYQILFNQERITAYNKIIQNKLTDCNNDNLNLWGSLGSLNLGTRICNKFWPNYEKNKTNILLKLSKVTCKTGQDYVNLITFITHLITHEFTDKNRYLLSKHWTYEVFSPVINWLFPPEKQHKNDQGEMKVRHQLMDIIKIIIRTCLLNPVLKENLGISKDRNIIATAIKIINDPYLNQTKEVQFILKSLAPNVKLETQLLQQKMQEQAQKDKHTRKTKEDKAKQHKFYTSLLAQLIAALNTHKVNSTGIFTKNPTLPASIVNTAKGAFQTITIPEPVSNLVKNTITEMIANQTLNQIEHAEQEQSDNINKKLATNIQVDKFATDLALLLTERYAALITNIKINEMDKVVKFVVRKICAWLAGPEENSISAAIEGDASDFPLLPLMGGIVAAETDNCIFDPSLKVNQIFSCSGYVVRHNHELKFYKTQSSENKYGYRFISAKEYEKLKFYLEEVAVDAVTKQQYACYLQEKIPFNRINNNRMFFNKTSQASQESSSSSKMTAAAARLLI